jgi:hypothetical protein
MMTLRNGKRIYKSTINGETDEQFGIVLAEWEPQGHDPFVTWSIHSVGDGEFIVSNGHYHTNYDAAESDYKERIKYI